MSPLVALAMLVVLALLVGAVSLIWRDDEPEHPMRRKTDQ